MPWITRKQALDLLGLPLAQLKRLVRHRLLCPRGKGRGQRFRREKVEAVAALWEELDETMPPAEEADEKADAAADD